MGLPEKLTALKESAESQLHALNSKEKTKTALLLPFFNALGYDPFKIRDVEPGYAVKLKGEGPRNVDYALKIDGAPAILFQCEEASADLDAFDGDPLYRHMGDLETSIVVLTNGLNYRFHANLGRGSGVDERPFLVFDLLDYEPEQVTYLKRLTKSTFDTQEALSAAFELKYTRLLQNYLVQQREAPDQHFVRFLAAQIYEGDVSEEVLKRFRSVVQTLLRQFDIEERQLPSQGTSPPDISIQTGVPSPSEDTTQPDDSSSPSEEETDVAVPAQETPADPSENSEQEEEVPKSGGDSENGELEDEQLEEDELQGGGNIAQEFADKVVGNS